MELTLDQGDGQFRIEAYKKGIIVVNGQDYSCSFFIMPFHLIAPFGPDSVKELSEEHVTQMLSYEPEVVLIGTGSKIFFPEQALFAACYDRQIGVEVMDTKAACRTYTVLMAEGRKVGALLIVEDE
jgi:uncharacterized protein